jgi:hypothetical protein
MTVRKPETLNRLLALTQKTSELASKHGIPLQLQKTYTAALSLAASSLIVAAGINTTPLENFTNYAKPAFNFSFDASSLPSLNYASKKDIYDGFTPTLIKHPFEDGNISMVINTDLLDNFHKLDISSYPDEVQSWLEKATKGLISDLTHSHCTKEYASLSAYKNDTCLTVLNLNDIDEYFDKYWGDTLYVSFNNIRDMMLNHELAHSNTLSIHATLLDETLNPESKVGEQLADLSAFHKAYKDLPSKVANEAVDGWIKMRNTVGTSHDVRQILRFAKAYYSSPNNDSLSIPDDKIIEHSVSMSKVFAEMVINDSILASIPDYHSHDVLPSTINQLINVPYSYYRKSEVLKRLHNEIGIDTNQVKAMNRDSKLDLYAANINLVQKHISASRENASDVILDKLRSTSLIPDNLIDITMFENKMSDLLNPILDTSNRIELIRDHTQQNNGPSQ